MYTFGTLRDIKVSVVGLRLHPFAKSVNLTIVMMLLVVYWQIRHERRF